MNAPSFIVQVLLYMLYIDYSFSFSLLPSKPFGRYCYISHSTPYITTMITMSSSSSVTNSDSSERWKTLDVSKFSNLTSNECRFAKDEQYLKSVLDLWKQEEDEGKIRRGKLSQQVETSPWTYYDHDQTPLYGHIVKPIIGSSVVEKDIRNENDYDNKDNDNDSSRPLYPGILMFHTAAGPQDVFLFQKAVQLASSELQCVVLICDILSDPCGWAWSPDGDRTRYNQVRQRLLHDNGRLMRSRVNASVQTLIGDVDNNDNFSFSVDPNRLAAMGWCLGAQPILELLTLNNSKELTRVSVDTLISFHGVFRRDPLPPSEHLSSSSLDENSSTTGRTRDVLICNGKCDPFVSHDDIEITKRSMEEKMYNVTVLEFDGAKHGFTNPAQNFNENNAFEYNEYASKESWSATMELLKRKLL